MNKLSVFLLLTLLAACGSDHGDSPMLETFQIVSSNGTQPDIGETTLPIMEAFD